MLCLNRMAGQRVIMRVPNGPVITILIDKIKGTRVRLMIDAPQIVTVDREEIDASKGNEVIPRPDKESGTRSITRLWKAMGEPMHLTDDSLIRQAAVQINALKSEIAAIKQNKAEASQSRQDFIARLKKLDEDPRTDTRSACASCGHAPPCKHFPDISCDYRPRIR